MEPDETKIRAFEAIVIFLGLMMLSIWICCCYAAEKNITPYQWQANAAGGEESQSSRSLSCDLNNDCLTYGRHLERVPSFEDLPPSYDEVVGLLRPNPQSVYEQSTERILPVQMIRVTTL